MAPVTKIIIIIIDKIKTKLHDMEYIETVTLAAVTNKESDFRMRWKTLATLLSLQKCFCVGLWRPLCKPRL